MLGSASANAVFIITRSKSDVTGVAIIAVTPITWLIIINKFIAIIVSYFQVVLSSIIEVKSIIMQKLSGFLLKIITRFDLFHLRAVVNRSVVKCTPLDDFEFDQSPWMRSFAGASPVVLMKNHHPSSCLRHNLLGFWYVPSFESLFEVHC